MRPGGVKKLAHVFLKITQEISRPQFSNFGSKTHTYFTIPYRDWGFSSTSLCVQKFQPHSSLGFSLCFTEWEWRLFRFQGLGHQEGSGAKREKSPKSDSRKTHQVCFPELMRLHCSLIPQRLHGGPAPLAFCKWRNDTAGCICLHFMLHVGCSRNKYPNCEWVEEGWWIGRGSGDA